MRVDTTTTLRDALRVTMQERDAARDVLRYIEWCWDGETDRCPACGCTVAVGHDGSCWIAAVLS